MKKNIQIIILSIILILPMTVEPAMAKDQCGDHYLGRKNTDRDKLCLYEKDSEFPCECPENEIPVCDMEYIESEDTFQEIIICAKSEDIDFQTKKIPYIFETGIPLVVKKGEQLEAMSLSDLVERIIRATFSISGILAFVMIIVGGIQYMISGGDTKKQKSAQETIINAVLGLILLFGFWLILHTINPDILRTSSSFNIEDINGNGDNNDDQPTTAQEISKKLLDGGENFEILWTAAKKDLQDVIDNKCISIYNNSTTRASNCITQYGTKDPATNTIHPYPDCPTINKDLLIALDYLINTKFEEIKNGLSNTCSPKLLISPFLSDHYYCSSPAGSHKYGCSTDITVKDNNNENAKFCTQQLLKLLCPGISNLNICQNVFTCFISLGGVPIGIVNETNCAGTDPHLHIQARNCKYP